MIPIVCLGLCAFTPIYQAHDSQKKTDDEFVNVYAQVQPQQFKVVASTPNLLDLKDGEIVIVSTSPPVATRLMFRNGQEIFAIGVSCVTVRR